MAIASREFPGKSLKLSKLNITYHYLCYDFDMDNGTKLGNCLNATTNGAHSRNQVFFVKRNTMLAITKSLLTLFIFIQVPKSASLRCPLLSKSMLSGFTSLKIKINHTHYRRSTSCIKQNADQKNWEHQSKVKDSLASQCHSFTIHVLATSMLDKGYGNDFNYTLHLFHNKGF